MLKKSEAQIQIELFAWIRAEALRDPRYDLFFSTLNGAHLKDSGRSWSFLYAMGASPGLPDLIGLCPSYYNGALKHGLIIELKKPGGTMRVQQTRWLARLNTFGFECQKIDSLDVAKNLIKKWIDNALFDSVGRPNSAPIPAPCSTSISN